MSEPIPLSRPLIDEHEEELVLEVLRSRRLALGPMTERFESLLAAATGAPYAVAVSSGTAGLHLSVRRAGLGPGDEVITSPFSFVASANCILYEGATPVFVDVDDRTLNLDAGAIEAAITPATKGILPVDIFGYPADLTAIRAIAERHDLVVIEDACEAIGATHAGAPVGSHGHPAVFAFYPNKQVTTGEGGAVTAQSEEEHAWLKSAANQGRSDSGGWLEHVRLGFNYRIDELSAAVGVAQLEKLDRLLALRAEAAARYTAALDGRDGIGVPAADAGSDVRSWFVYVVRLDGSLDREAVIAALAADGIATSRYLPSIHLQPYMRDHVEAAPGSLPVSEAASASSLALPFFPEITDEQQERVVAALARAVADG